MNPEIGIEKDILTSSISTGKGNDQGTLPELRFSSRI
jgi:hypothetical protein